MNKQAAIRAFARLAMVFGVFCTAWGPVAHAVEPECAEPVGSAADVGKIEAAQERIQALQAKWSAGDFAGPDPHAGTTTTNGAIEEQIKVKQAEVDKLRADPDEIVASSGFTTASGKQIKEAIARAERAGYDEQASTLRKSYAVWEKAALRIIEGKEEDLRNLYEVAEAVRDRFEKQIAGIEQDMADIRDRAARENACREAKRPQPPRAQPPAPQQQTMQPQPEGGPPTVKSLDDQIAKCQMLTGDERDICLANLVLTHDDPAPCQAVPKGRCGELVGTVLMGDCAARYQGFDLAVCEQAAAERVRVAGVCRAASDPGRCIVAVASETGDPKIIADEFADAAERDRLLAVYASMTGDPSTFDLILDNEVHDGAIILSAYAVASARGEPLNADRYCGRLVGGYGGEYGDSDAVINRDVCGLAVTMTNRMLDRDRMAETELSEEELRRELGNLIERFGNGDTSLNDFMGEGLVE